MTNVLVRNLPDQVHETLLRRAQASGRSLQQYLADELTQLAERLTMDEALDRIAARTGGRIGLEQAVVDLAETRSDR